MEGHRISSKKLIAETSEPLELVSFEWGRPLLISVDKKKSLYVFFFREILFGCVPLD